MRLGIRLKEEDGQSIVLVALAMSIFLIGAVGLGFDGSNLYSNRQKAQLAADAAAQAAMMSVFDGTNTANVATTGFTATAGTSFTCTTTDTRTPCKYASMNGFGGTSIDTVLVAFSASAIAGVNLSPASADPTNSATVTITRKVNTTLMRLLGPTFTNVKATATAAIVGVTSPTPILVTDPTNANTLSMNGNTSITICGGPNRSIQVNSSSTTAFTGGGTVDLSHAGPADTSGNCTTGTGADFGAFGGQAANPGILLGTTGHYDVPSSPIQDPLANVTAPSAPAAAPAPASIAKGTDGCLINSGCTEYSPGLYSSLKPGNNNVIFKPGLYYVNGGGVDFKQMTGGGGAPDYNAMCVGCAADTNTGTGMLIYDTGPLDAQGFANTGQFNIGTNADFTIQGPTLTTTNSLGQIVPAAPYYGILFWEDRNAEKGSHTLGQGNGCFTLIGTIYITNTQAIMKNTADANYPNHVQIVTYNGNPCSTTVNQGDIIVGQLGIVGSSAIKMNLVPYGFLIVRQVALVQ